MRLSERLRAREQARERFVDLYRKHYGVIVATIERRVSSFQTAEDLAEQVFTVAWERMKGGEEIDVPWLYLAARNKIGNEYQRRQSAEDVAELISERLEPAKRADATARRVEIRRRIRALDEETRELVYMAYWEELTGDEIARILHCSADAARKRLQRARTAVRAVTEDLCETREGAANGRA